MKTRWLEHETPSNEDIRDEILRLLMSLRTGESICPSDAARCFGGSWRKYMTQVLNVAADMVRDGQLEIVQRGEVVDIDERKVEEIRGPIRLRLSPNQVLEVDDDSSLLNE